MIPEKPSGWFKAAVVFITVASLEQCFRLYRMFKKGAQDKALLKDFPSIVTPDETSWLFGSLLVRFNPVNRHRPHDFLLERMLALGEDTGALTFNMRNSKTNPEYTLITLDPDVVEHILETGFDNFTKQIDPRENPFFSMFSDWLGKGIFALPHGPDAVDGGSRWLKQRKVAARIFTRNNFNNLMAECFEDNMHNLVGVVGKAADNGEFLDMQEKCFAFTMDAAMNVFYGRKTTTVLDAKDEFATAFDDIQRHLLQFFHFNMPKIMLASTLPSPLGGPNGWGVALVKLMSSQARAFYRCLAVLNTESYRIVDEKRADPALATDRSLIALFMNQVDDDNLPFSHPKHRMLMRDVLMSFLLAGRDTTACTLTWALFVAATEPDVMTRLVEEIDRGYEERGGRPPQLADLAAGKMPYLQGFVYEVLRLYPPVPTDFKTTFKPTSLPDGRVVPARTTIMFFPYGMGRDPRRYPDPLAVQPTRWIPFKSPSPFEFPQFQAGPRICLGKDMALFEAKYVLCVLLRHFSFALKPGERENITYATAITMSLANSLKQDSTRLWLQPSRRVLT
jgi:cytochrome P450